MHFYLVQPKAYVALLVFLLFTFLCLVWSEIKTEKEDVVVEECRQYARKMNDINDDQLYVELRAFGDVFGVKLRRDNSLLADKYHELLTTHEGTKNHVLTILPGYYVGENGKIQMKGMFDDGDGLVYGKVWLGGHTQWRLTAVHQDFQKVFNDTNCLLVHPERYERTRKAKAILNRPKRSVDDERKLKEIDAHSTCGWSYDSVSASLNGVPGAHPNVSHDIDLDHYGRSFFGRQKRQADVLDKFRHPKFCEIYLMADPLLYRHYRKKYQQDGPAIVTKVKNFLLSMAAELNDIYDDEVFMDGSTDIRNIKFKVQRIRVVTDDVCSRNTVAGGPTEDKVFRRMCSNTLDVSTYLNQFSKINHDQYCLAYSFTHREFSDGVLGLAWVSSPPPHSRAGVCDPWDTVKHRILNTGIVTTLNYGSDVGEDVTAITFAHEVGHNFGAPHDEPSCIPNGNDGNFIMYASAADGKKANNKRFSPCSVRAIGKNLHWLISSPRNCFRFQDEPFCGNGKVEGDEVCDCGFEDDCKQSEPSMKCCNPAGDTATAASQCRLYRASNCSPNMANASCCDASTCSPVTDTSVVCQSNTNECQRPAKCDGQSYRCPPNAHNPNNTLCHAGTRLCRSGACKASLCDLIGFEACESIELAKAKENDDDGQFGRELLCHLACRSPATKRCYNSYYVNSTNTGLMIDEFRDLLLDPTKYLGRSINITGSLKPGHAVLMPPGSTCDELRGYCDVFHRCRTIDSKGPLMRITDMIFSKRAVESVMSWIRTNWWAVLLICIGVVLLMAVFIQVCSVHTPSSNPNLPQAKRFADTLRAPSHFVSETLRRRKPPSRSRHAARQTSAGSGGGPGQPGTSANGQNQRLSGVIYAADVARQQSSSSAQRQNSGRPPKQQGVPPPSSQSGIELRVIGGSNQGPPHGRGKRRPPPDSSASSAIVRGSAKGAPC